MRTKEPRRVKKVRSVNENAPAKLEGWLSSMAKKGWFLKEVTPSYYLFEEGEPEEMEYRMLYFYQNVFEEQEQRYREAGWDILKLWNDYYLLMAKASSHPSEEYFTELEKTEWKEKNMWMWWVYGALALYFLVEPIRLLWSSAPGVWLNYYLCNQNLDNLLAMLCAGIGIFINAIDSIQGRKYAKRVERLGKDAHHKKTWMYPYTYRIKVVCFIAIGVALICTNHEGYSQEEISEVENIPLITAQEIKEATKIAVYEESYTKERWNYSGDKYSGDITLVGQEEDIREVYYPVFRSLNKEKGLLSVLYDGGYLEKNTKTVELQQEGFDCMLYAKQWESHVIAAQKGKQVLVIKAPKTIAKETLQAMVTKKLA